MGAGRNINTTMDAAACASDVQAHETISAACSDVIRGLGPAAVVAAPCWEDPPADEDLFSTCQKLMKLLTQDEERELSLSPPRSVRINPPPGFLLEEKLQPRGVGSRCTSGELGGAADQETSCGSSASATDTGSPAELPQSSSWSPLEGVDDGDSNEEGVHDDDSNVAFERTHKAFGCWAAEPALHKEKIRAAPCKVDRWPTAPASPIPGMRCASPVAPGPILLGRLQAFAKR